MGGGSRTKKPRHAAAGGAQARKSPTESPASHWSAAHVARGVVLGFLVAGALGVVAPGGAIVAFALAGFAVGVASQDFIDAAVCSALGIGTITVLMMVAPSSPALPAAASGTLAIAALAGVAGSALGVFATRTTSQHAMVVGALVIIVAIFLVPALQAADTLAPSLKAEFADESYGYDPVFFIKVFQLQERGVGFYDAYGQAFVADARFDAPTADLAGWRSPTTTTLWSLLLPHGASLTYVFALLAAVAMAGSWMIASKVGDPASALAAPALLAPYYLSAIRDIWFPEYEFWAMFAVIASAVLLIYKRPRIALGFAVLAGAMREWLVSGVVAGATHLLVRKKWREAIPWVIGTVAVVAFYVANMYVVRRYLVGVGVQPDLGATGRLGGGGPAFILYTLQFCSKLFAHVTVLPYAAFGLGLAGTVASIVRRQYYVPALLLVPLAAFMVFGSGRVPGDEIGWNDYYNAAFMPIAFILATGAWKVFERVKKADRTS